MGNWVDALWGARDVRGFPKLMGLRRATPHDPVSGIEDQVGGCSARARMLLLSTALVRRLVAFAAFALPLSWSLYVPTRGVVPLASRPKRRGAPRARGA